MAVALSMPVFLGGACDALNFEGLNDKDDKDDNSKDKNTPQIPEVPEDPNANVFFYPVRFFTSANVLYTDGSRASSLPVSTSVQAASFAIPAAERGKTIYSITLSPTGVTVLVGRNAGERIEMEFSSDGRNLIFRTNTTGVRYTPIRIGVYGELIKLRDMLDKSTWTVDSVTSTQIQPDYLNAAFIQDGDIDLLGDISYKAYNLYHRWQPIGVVASTPADTMLFAGVYDGNGKKLLNLTIETDAEKQGLFAGIAAPGVVKNLHIRFGEIEAGNTSGIIAGTNAGTIENCVVSDSVITKALTPAAGYKLGGICGENLYGGKITASYFLGNVTGVNSVGGIAGVNSSTIEACYHYGAVVGTGSDVHHIAGDTPVSTTDCYWYNPTTRGILTDAQNTEFSASTWPAFPSPDDNPAHRWAEYKIRGAATVEDGRWKGTLGALGTASDSPARADLPKLWFD
ncbi:MAG: hypothetical protein LBG74_08755 [Spirochaetaceae bacterium]|nr:hypothetical protein [Spirochaetaceae bacterium]